MKTKIARVALAATMTLLGLMIPAVLTSSAASAAPANGGSAYTCTGGNIAPGTYKSIIVAGICYMPAGTIIVRHNLWRPEPCSTPTPLVTRMRTRSSRRPS